MSLFDRAHMTSYKLFITTMVLSRTVSEMDGDFSQKSKKNSHSPFYFASPLKGFPLELVTSAGS